MVPDNSGSLISVMLAVPDAPAAVAWYIRALGATELWSLGSVAGMEIAGARHSSSASRPRTAGRARRCSAPRRCGWRCAARIRTDSSPGR